MHPSINYIELIVDSNGFLQYTVYPYECVKVIIMEISTTSTHLYQGFPCSICLFSLFLSITLSAGMKFIDIQSNFYGSTLSILMLNGIDLMTFSPRTRVG